jgi:ABC-type polar amino acid transport system ATPase subunit
LIKVENLSKKFGNIPALNDVSFSAPANSVLGIIGESGSGKTTLLMCLSGLITFEYGTISCNDFNITANTQNGDKEKYWKMRRLMGIVFQHLYLFPHLTALANVIEAPIHVLKTPKEEAIDKAVSLLCQLGLKHCLYKYPDQLSGGEQQRVAIARSLIMNPDVLLLDEPTSALDPVRSGDVRALLNNYVNEGHSVIIVSHSINFLRGLASNILYMENGEVIEFGTAEEIFYAPKDARTKNFLMSA